VHLELKKDGMVWLRCDDTDLGIGEIFIKKGIPKKTLFLLFISPQMRELIFG